MSIINHPQVPPPDVTPVFAALLEVAAADRGLPPDPWPLPPAASPRAQAEAAEARARECPLCGAAPGVPCSLGPVAYHLARFLEACIAGRLTREFMAAVLGELAGAPE